LREKHNAGFGYSNEHFNLLPALNSNGHQKLLRTEKNPTTYKTSANMNKMGSVLPK